MEVPKGTFLYRGIEHKLLLKFTDANKPLNMDQNMRIITEFLHGRLSGPYRAAEETYNEWDRLCKRFLKTGDSTGVNEAFEEYSEAMGVLDGFCKRMLNKNFGTYKAVRRFRDQVFEVINDEVPCNYYTDDD